MNAGRHDASDEARYVQGALVDVDGGRTAG